MKAQQIFEKNGRLYYLKPILRTKSVTDKNLPHIIKTVLQISFCVYRICNKVGFLNNQGEKIFRSQNTGEYLILTEMRLASRGLTQWFESRGKIPNKTGLRNVIKV